jgi:hypothetical protein
VPSSDNVAGDQTLDIPFPRGDGRLVEVVEIEHHCAVRRGVEANVGHIRVSAAHHLDPARRPSREVGGHHGGRSAVEGKGIGQHPGEPKRYEFGDPVGVLGAKDLGGAARTGDQLGECASRRPLAQRPPMCDIALRHLQIDDPLA